MITRGLKALAGWFWRELSFPYREVFASPDVAFERGQMLVRLTYVAWFIYGIAALRDSIHWANPPQELLWHVAWVRQVPWQPTVAVIVSVGALFALLAALSPRIALFRLLAFLGAAEAQGIRFSYTKIDHSSHAWLFALFLLVFLTRLSPEPTAKQKQSFNETIWSIQAVTLACYSVAGIQKLWGAWIDAGYGGPTVFHPDALGIHLAYLTLRGEAGGVLSGYVLEHSWAGYPLMLSALYLEVVALAIALRPGLHRFWAAGLMGMHTGIALVMNIWFDPMLLMVGAWFMLSPFANSSASVTMLLRDLPWFGPPLSALCTRAFQRPERVVIFYDGECALCNWVVRMLLRLGTPDTFFFASQQGKTWQALTSEKPYLRNADSVVVLSQRDGENEVRIRSEAVFWMLAQLRGVFALSWAVMIVPLPFLNCGYRLVAVYTRQAKQRRPAGSCPLPPPELRERLLD